MPDNISNKRRDLSDILSEFQDARGEHNAPDIAPLMMDLQAWLNDVHIVPGTVETPSEGLISRVEELVARIEMIQFSVCAAQRPAAIEELVEEFQKWPGSG